MKHDTLDSDLILVFGRGKWKMRHVADGLLPGRKEKELEGESHIYKGEPRHLTATRGCIESVF